MHNDYLVEFKCPYPNNDMLPVHYEIPVYYAIQLLAGMKVKNVSKALYASFSKSSTAVILLKFQENVWNKIFGLILTSMDTNNPEYPKRAVQYKVEIRSLLKDYIAQNSEFLCEVPSVFCKENENNFSRKAGPYILPISTRTFNLTYSGLFNKLKLLLDEC